LLSRRRTRCRRVTRSAPIVAPRSPSRSFTPGQCRAIRSADIANAKHVSRPRQDVTTPPTPNRRGSVRGSTGSVSTLRRARSAERMLERGALPKEHPPPAAPLGRASTPGGMQLRFGRRSTSWCTMPSPSSPAYRRLCSRSCSCHHLPLLPRATRKSKFWRHGHALPSWPVMCDAARCARDQQMGAVDRARGGSGGRIVTGHSGATPRTCSSVRCVTWRRSGSDPCRSQPSKLTQDPRSLG
jgi:hypothetical protein